MNYKSAALTMNAKHAWYSDGDCICFQKLQFESPETLVASIGICPGIVYRDIEWLLYKFHSFHLFFAPFNFLKWQLFAFSQSTKIELTDALFGF